MKNLLENYSHFWEWKIIGTASAKAKYVEKLLTAGVTASTIEPS